MKRISSDRTKRIGTSPSWNLEPTVETLIKDQEDHCRESNSNFMGESLPSVDARGAVPLLILSRFRCTIETRELGEEWETIQGLGLEDRPPLPAPLGRLTWRTKRNGLTQNGLSLSARTVRRDPQKAQTWLRPFRPCPKGEPPFLLSGLPGDVC